MIVDRFARVYAGVDRRLHRLHQTPRPGRSLAMVTEARTTVVFVKDQQARRILRREERTHLAYVVADNCSCPQNENAAPTVR